MTELVGLSRLLHVVVAMCFVAGLVGRTISMAAARTSQDIQSVADLTLLAGSFVRFLANPGSQPVLVFRLTPP